jgi:hypothetical protein
MLEDLDDAFLVSGPSKRIRAGEPNSIFDGHLGAGFKIRLTPAHPTKWRKFLI